VPVLAELASGRWDDLGKRVLSALVLAPVALACVWLGGTAFVVVVAVAMIGLVVEWLGLCRRSGWTPLRPIGLAYVALAGAALLWLRNDPDAGRALT